MTEMINGCIQWFTEIEPIVSSFLTPATFASAVTVVITVIRMTRSNKRNLLASGELKTSLNLNNGLSKKVDALKEELERRDVEMAKIHKENEELKNLISTMRSDVLDICNSNETKIRAMIDVQSVVYSTIKDENIRNTVNGLLTNAKYSESISRAKLRKEAEDLKSKMADKVTEIQSIVESAANVVEGIVDSDKNNILRY